MDQERDEDEVDEITSDVVDVFCNLVDDPEERDAYDYAEIATEILFPYSRYEQLRWIRCWRFLPTANEHEAEIWGMFLDALIDETNCVAADAAEFAEEEE
jgi:hypothetical protein